jgi:hypothetical protein
MCLDNPNIVKLYEIYEFNQSVYLVTEYGHCYIVCARADSYLTVWIERGV